LPAFTGYDNATHDNDGLSTQYAFYAQDSVRLNPRLTLEDGLRYEHDPAYTDESGNIGNFDPKPPLSGSTVYPDGSASDLAPGYLNSFDASPNPPLPYTANNPIMINGTTS
jgi:outer membrane receptor protein involved in Fe transport